MPASSSITDPFKYSETFRHALGTCESPDMAWMWSRAHIAPNQSGVDVIHITCTWDPGRMSVPSLLDGEGREMGRPALEGHAPVHTTEGLAMRNRQSTRSYHDLPSSEASSSAQRHANTMWLVGNIRGSDSSDTVTDPGTIPVSKRTWCTPR